MTPQPITAAAAQSMADRRAAVIERRELSHWTLTADELTAKLDGARLGRIKLQRDTARDILSHYAALVTDGAALPVAPPAIDFIVRRGPDTPEVCPDGREWREIPRSVSEARLVAADAESRKAKRGTVSAADERRMTSADIALIASRAARAGAALSRRMRDPRLSDEEYRDLTAACVADIVKRAAAAERPNLAVGPPTAHELHGRAARLNASGAAAAAAWRTARYEMRPPQPNDRLPLWRAVEDINVRDVLAAVDPTARDFLRDRWSAATYYTAKRWAIARHAELAERVAPTVDADQVLADYLHGAREADALASASVDEVSDLYSQNERAALEIALLPPAKARKGSRGGRLRTVVDLAAARGVRPETLTVRGVRGRADLAKRYGIPADLPADDSPRSRSARRDVQRDVTRAVRADLATIAPLAADQALRTAVRMIPAVMHDDRAHDASHALIWPAVVVVGADEIPARIARTDASGAALAEPMRPCGRILAPTAVAPMRRPRFDRRRESIRHRSGYPYPMGVLPLPAAAPREDLSAMLPSATRIRAEWIARAIGGRYVTADVLAARRAAWLRELRSEAASMRRSSRAAASMSGPLPNRPTPLATLPAPIDRSAERAAWRAATIAAAPPAKRDAMRQALGV